MFLTPSGMTRRHFMTHMAGAASFALPAFQFVSHLRANADKVRKAQKACILVWLNGGPPTIDMWDLKPGSKNGGEFQPISTSGDLQISEHLPETAKVMDVMSVVRSMSTREADHERGRYFMHTCFVPNPTVVHPTFGSVVSYELGKRRAELEIPSFVSIGGGSFGPGFLGMAHAPFVVDQNGRIQNAEVSETAGGRLKQRLAMLEVVEDNFIHSKRGDLGKAHKDVYKKAVNLMTSKQMEAFKIESEPEALKTAYGNNGFGNGMLMARRLVETGVPFVEVQFPGSWDLHSGVFNALKQTNLPMLDKGLAGLVNDLKQRGMMDDTVVVVMGEFGRTPRINQDVGRDHWATSWSVAVGGGGLRGGVAVGSTDKDGTSVVDKAYLPGDLWATVSHALGIPLSTVHTSTRGRPMKLANGGTPIQDLITKG